MTTRLVAETGRMTFPQILLDGKNIGGFQELAQLDRAGRLKEYAEPEAA